MTAEDAARKGRAAQRGGSMRIHKATLGEPEVDFSPTAGEAAISLLTQLSRESFSLAGREAPEYSRQSIPVRFIPRSR